MAKILTSSTRRRLHDVLDRVARLTYTEAQGKRPSTGLDVLPSSSLKAECYIANTTTRRQKVGPNQHTLVDWAVVGRKHGIDTRVTTPVEESGQVDRAIADGNLAPVNDAGYLVPHWVTQDMFTRQVTMDQHRR